MPWTMRKLRTKRKQVEGEARIWLAFGIVFCGFGLAAANQMRVQWFGRDQVLKNAIAVNRLDSSRQLTPRRGAIYSSDDRVLARNSDAYRIGINPANVPRNPALYVELSDATGISASELYDYATRGPHGAEWDVVLTGDQAEQIDRIKRRYHADGLWRRHAGERTYPIGESAAALVGFVENGRGAAGIEKGFETLLAGEPGVQIGMTDADGQFLPWTINSSQSRPKVDGQDIVLTINSDLQRVAMEALRSTCELNKPLSGIALVLDPASGDVLAAATWPTFKPEQFKEARLMTKERSRTSPELNPTVALAFEPGSTFKLFTVALGLDFDVVGLGDTVNCAGGKQFSVKTIKCAKNKKHGLVTPERCISESCNLAAATWGVRVGFDRYLSFIKKAGFLKKPDVGLLPQAAGIFNEKDANKTIQMANVGFGQSINVTPLRLASAFTAFANGGVMREPRLIKSVGGEDRKLAQSIRLFSHATADRVLKMMVACVQSPEGTGYGLRVPGYTLAGKTGTAQKLGSAPGDGYVSSFVGVVPAIKPKAVVLVMIDSPSQGVYYGGSVAGPVFNRIAKFLIQMHHVTPDRPEELAVEVR